MKVFFIILPIAGLIFASCFSQEESKRKNTEPNNPQAGHALLSISLKPGERATFNIFDVYSRGIAFRNVTVRDSIYEEKIWIDKPLFLVYGNILMIPDGDPLFRTYSLLLNPGTRSLERP